MYDVVDSLPLLPHVGLLFENVLAFFDDLSIELTVKIELPGGVSTFLLLFISQSLPTQPLVVLGLFFDLNR